MSETSNRWARVGAGASVLVHAVGFWALGSVPKASVRPLSASMVDFEVPKPSEVEPVPEPEPEPEPALPSEPVPSRPTEPEAVPEPEPAEPAVADLTGLTLTSTGAGSGWDSAVGNGQAMERPIRAGLAAKSASREPVPAPKPAVVRSSKPKGPAVVPVKDLSTKPVPPNLNGVLEAHYPKSAREMGLEGNAVVRLRIDPDGQVRLASVLSESGAGFGSACQKTVLGSNWSAPRDHDGNSVATYVRYTCRFRVNR